MPGEFSAIDTMKNPDLTPFHHSPFRQNVFAVLVRKFRAALSILARISWLVSPPALRAAEIIVLHSLASMNEAATSNCFSSPKGIAKKPCLSA